MGVKNQLSVYLSLPGAMIVRAEILLRHFSGRGDNGSLRFGEAFANTSNRWVKEVNDCTAAAASSD